MDEASRLIQIALLFVPLSLSAIGGATVIYAPLQYAVVDLHHWMGPAEYLDYFAVCRFAPGPSSMLGVVIGWKVAGYLGAVVAAVALYLPSSVICYGVGRLWTHYRGTQWHTALQRGLASIAAGLVLAGVLSLYQLAGGGALTASVICGAAALLTWRKRLHPLFLLVAGGLIFEAAYQWGGLG